MNPPHPLAATVAHFGSLRATLVGLALLAGAALSTQVENLPSGLALAVSLSLLGLNLLGAMVVHPAMRRQLALLVFHMALLCVVLLAALGRLTALDGRFELAQGVGFDGNLIESSVGRWHRNQLAQLVFRHDGFEIAYAPGRKRGETRNLVTWRNPDGTSQSAIIGDHRPLVLDGYRFYTSPNKGFAPHLTWSPEHGDQVTGVVHLPSYPAHELRQSREWALPDGRKLWVMLQMDEILIDPAAHASFRMPTEHRLIVRLDTQRVEMVPGQRIDVAGGTLVYDHLGTWMGYRVSYDWTLPWLLAASLLGVGALAWHYTRRFFFTPQSAAPLQVGGEAIRGAADG